MEETPRRIGRSILAILAGFIVVVILSIATDLLMHVIGLYPQLGQAMSDKLLVVATIYRSVYSILGSYITARLAPYQPMLHALWGGVIGFVLAIIGAVTTWNRGPAFGPHWYPIALIITALPCAWAGGKLFEIQTSK
jgi:hypothetical protein